MKRISIFTLLLVLVLSLTACSSGGDELSINDAWARPGQADGNTAIYFLIDNTGGEADKLLSAHTDVAGDTQLHMSMMDDAGTMKMNEQENIPVGAGETVELKPGGLHVMLIKLTKDLSAGDTVALTLTFENAGEMSLEVPVQEP